MSFKFGQSKTDSKDMDSDSSTDDEQTLNTNTNTNANTPKTDTFMQDSEDSDSDSDSDQENDNTTATVTATATADADDEDADADVDEDEDEDSDDDDDQDNNTKTKTKSTKNSKTSKGSTKSFAERSADMWAGKSATVRIAPLYNFMTAVHVYDFLKDVAIPINYSFQLPKFRFGKNKASALYYAQIAYVTFETPEDALNVVAQKHKQNIMEHLQPFVNHAGPANQTVLDLKGKTNWIQLSNLNFTTDEQSIASFIKDVGQITNPPKEIVVYHNPKNQKLPGFAYIELKNTKDAVRCVDNMCFKELDEKRVYVTYRKIRKPFQLRKELAGETKTISICNVHYSVDNVALTTLCKPFGAILGIKVWRNTSGFSIGRACVTFKSSAEAEDAVAGLQNKKFTGMKLCVGYTDFDGEDYFMKAAQRKKDRQNGDDSNTRPRNQKNKKYLQDKNINKKFSGNKNKFGKKNANKIKDHQKKSTSGGKFSNKKSSWKK